MQTYIAILRGINVSGQKLIRMKDLQALFETMGLKNASTYIQSGNVVFQAGSDSRKELEERISAKISEKFGFQVPVMVRDKDEWESAVRNNPFAGGSYDQGRLHVTFLSSTPDPGDIDKIKNGNYGVDEFKVTGSVVYLSCPEGYGITRLNNNFFENRFKVTATTRNWKTVNELMAMAKSMESN